MKKLLTLVLSLTIFLTSFAKGGKIAFILPETNYQEAEIFNSIDIVKKEDLEYGLVGIKK